MSHLHPNQIWRYATATASAHERGCLREHARACSRCRTALARAVITYRALRPEVDLLAPGRQELASWRDEILTRVAPGRPRSAWRWVGAGLALTTAALAVALAVSPRDATLVARGATTTPRLAARALCVVTGSDGDRQIIDPERAPCPVGAYLQLVVSSRGATRPRLTAALFAAGHRLLLVPNDDGAPLPRVPNAPRPLAGSYELRDEWAGAVVVVVLAVDEDRLSADDALWRWAVAASPGSYLDLLDRADAVVVPITVERR